MFVDLKEVVKRLPACCRSTVSQTFPGIFMIKNESDFVAVKAMSNESQEAEQTEFEPVLLVMPISLYLGEDDLGISNFNLRGALYSENTENRLNGGDSDDEIIGEDGNDIVSAGRGNDRIDGGYGNDTLYGQDGNDVLRAGFGNDELTGGAGLDDFTFYAAGNFKVMDFSASDDKIVFDTATTGIKNLDDLMGLITSISDLSDGVLIEFGQIASITLVGLTSADLNNGMVHFD